MLNKIKQFFDSRLLPEPQQSKAESETASRLAMAALMLEVAESDYQDQPEEKAVLLAVAKKSFDLDEEHANELVELARKEHAESTDYFQFTSLINQTYSETQKIELIENLWRVAYADNILHKYEEHVIRRIADLIYVSHKDFVASKLRVQKSMTHHPSKNPEENT